MRQLSCLNDGSLMVFSYINPTLWRWGMPHLTLEMDKNKHLDLVNLMIYLASPYLFVIFLKFSEVGFYGPGFTSYNGTFKYIINRMHLGRFTEMQNCLFHDRLHSIWLENLKKQKQNSNKNNNTVFFGGILLKT